MTSSTATLSKSIVLPYLAIVFSLLLLSKDVGVLTRTGRIAPLPLTDWGGGWQAVEDIGIREAPGPERAGKKVPAPLHTLSLHPVPYRGASLTRNSADLGPYGRTLPRAIWWS